MFPVLKRFDEEKIPYKFIHTCQHYGIVEENRKLFGVRKPDLYLTLKEKDLRNIWDMIVWAIKVLWKARKLPIRRNDYVIVHGDTESTLLGLLIGLYYKSIVVHIEAGLRSGDLLEPFPEEIIRRIVSRFSRICFCPTIRDAAHLNARNKKIIVTYGNTIFDSVTYALNLIPSKNIKLVSKLKFTVFLIHRKENLFIKHRIEKIFRILEFILQRGIRVIWVLHANTIYELKAKGMWPKITELQAEYKLTVFDHFLDYVDFMYLVKKAQFTASDGGGLQEETYVLDKPLLILRKKTERAWGVNETAYLSGLNKKKVRYFLDHVSQFRRKTTINKHPTDVIVNYFKSLS